MANKLNPFTEKISIWDLRDWAHEELKTGNRIKAGKLNRLANKYEFIQRKRGSW